MSDYFHKKIAEVAKEAGLPLPVNFVQAKYMLDKVYRCRLGGYENAILACSLDSQIAGVYEDDGSEVDYNVPLDVMYPMLTQGFKTLVNELTADELAVMFEPCVKISTFDISNNVPRLKYEVLDALYHKPNNILSKKAITDELLARLSEFPALYCSLMPPIYGLISAVMSRIATLRTGKYEKLPNELVLEVTDSYKQYEVGSERGHYYEGYVWYSRCKTLYTRNRKVVDNVLFTGGEAETVATKFIWYNDSYVERIPTSTHSNLERDIFSLEEKSLEKILELLKQDDLWFSPSCQTIFKRGELCDFSEFKIN